ncbi:MAG: ABC transporter ATP-binding protein [Candidatus Riflebacteria bacterium]|nr:ABC transporter ATP-binding protein [Candidatus Riflebacteria bacterium]
MANNQQNEQQPPKIKRPGGFRPSDRFAEVQHASNLWGTLKRVWKYFAKEQLLLASVLLVVIIGTICSVYAPALQSKAIDIIAKKSDGSLNNYIGGMLAAYLVFSLMTMIQGLCCAKLSQRIVKKMREELLAKIIDLPVSYLDTHSHGDVMSRMTNDIENISNTVSGALPSIFSGVLTIICTVSIMFWYCWQLALLSMLTVVFTLLATNFLSTKVRKYSKKRSSLLGQLNGTVEEMVSGYRTVVAYNHQDITINNFSETSDKLTKAGIRTEIFSGIMGPVMNAINNISFVIIATFGGYFAYKGIITVGVISAFIIYAKQFGRPINEISLIYGQLQNAIAGAERVFLVLDEENESFEGKECKIENAANIEFKNVNFSYVPGVPIINDFSLNIPSGKKVALVGSTGCGKTTIANLILRFYDIDSGEILIDGQNLSETSRDSLRNAIAIVLQDSILFTDTVKNNLKYADENASDEVVEKAAELSHCNKFIENLPEGYDTVLNAAGANLSQGQRQLLTIARAFVADPKILILDEATSNVDTRTEKAIQNAMQQVMKNRTSIVIAHRLSTIRDADIIIVMDKGHIVEQGTHESLLAAKGKYYDLYMTQYAGFAT